MEILEAPQETAVHMTPTNTPARRVLDGPDWDVAGSGVPDWWLERRRAAWETFGSLPMPRRVDEDWRFANVQTLSLEPFVHGGGLDPVLAGELAAASVIPVETAGRAVFANDRQLSFDPLPADLAARGVVWKPLALAVRENEALLKEYFMTHEPVLGSAKFAALHEAFCHAGSFLYVPKNVRIEKPLAVFHWMAGENTAVFPHTLILAEEGAEATVLDLFRSHGEAPGFACGVKDMVLGPNARINYLALQEWNENSVSFHLDGVSADRDAAAKCLTVNLGGAFVRAEAHSRLTGPNSRSDMLGLSVCHGTQEVDQRTLQSHCAPNTTSDLLYKNTLNHRSRSIFSGLIRVEEGARLTDAYQTNRNLLLDPAAEADSMPGLEILNDDVKCSHGATTGQIDEGELFYMLSRGISPGQAKHLIAMGFFEEILARFGHEEVTGLLRGRIESKFLRSAGISVASREEILPEETDVRQLQGTK